MKRGSNENLSGDEVYYTISLILLVKNMPCSKPRCQKGFDLIAFQYKILTHLGGWPSEGRCKATWKRELKLPWRKAGPPDHHDDRVNSDQEVVNKGISLCGKRPWVWGEGHFPVWQRCVGVGETGDVGEDLGVGGPRDERDVLPAHIVNYYGSLLTLSDCHSS